MTSVSHPLFDYILFALTHAAHPQTDHKCRDWGQDEVWECRREEESKTTNDSAARRSRKTHITQVMNATNLGLKFESQ
jgi:hypothetical protein